MGTQVPRGKTFENPLVITAALIGMVQGLLWFLLSLISVLFYENLITPDTGSENSAVDVDRTIFDIFLNRENNEIIIPYGGIIGPKEFNIYMHFYLVFSFSLLLISSAVIWAAITGKSKNHETRLFIWTINMIILSLLDVILVCLIGHDYHKLKVYYEDNFGPTAHTAGVTVIFVSFGVVMTLAARGFVLWIVNVTFICIFGKYLYKGSNEPHWVRLN